MNNLKPLEEWLTVDGYTFNEIADVLDEIAFDYAQTMLELQIADFSPKFVLHEKSASHLSLLKDLRDIFRMCSEESEE
jgi:hypothetical protein